ncbi:homoserine kinase [Clostridium ganghwense]|uniref:Homoserine kinase n=1 Tax=Clostridium ganghwense TaxID=312089 RepID=A0ABT4CQ64_9CLOT|nr:homoserine kinase [Clostridium ganghwense]MCY6370139.1 homoserine kinase [Clostridium ganghwense]
MIKIRIPATTANMGPGFDSFGMALKFYNEIWIEEIKQGIQVIQEGKPSEIPLEDNLIYTSLVKILNKYGYDYHGFKIEVKECNIPISRGLGSSAACIVAGITAANALMGNVLSTDDIIREAVEIEGHPDNIVPAVIGGMVVSLMDEDKVIYSKVNIPNDLRMFVMIPNFKLSTEEARHVLPPNYSNGDCIFNISRAAMFVNAMNNGELDKLRVSTQDRIHQNYRINLISDAEKIFEGAREYGSLAEFISGSGSTLMALVDKNNKGFEKKMTSFLNKLQDKWEVHLLEADVEGTTIL